MHALSRFLPCLLLHRAYFKAVEHIANQDTSKIAIALPFTRKIVIVILGACGQWANISVLWPSTVSECYYVDYFSAECCATMLVVIIISVFNAVCHYSWCHHAGYCYPECCEAKYHNAEWRGAVETKEDIHWGMTKMTFYSVNC